MQTIVQILVTREVHENGLKLSNKGGIVYPDYTLGACLGYCFDSTNLLRYVNFLQLIV